MDMVFWEWVFFLVREYGGIFLRGAGVALFLAVPSLASSVGVLVPVGALIAIGVARILYKKGLLG